MPTEELFGSYNIFSTPAGIAKLREIGVKPSPRGLQQALQGEIITDPNDRRAIAKLIMSFGSSLK